LYEVLYDYVPGFAGLRVPARYAMIAALYLSMLAGIGAAWLLPRTRGAVVTAILSLAFLVEAAFAPMYVNETWGEGSVVPPAHLEPAASAPAVYRHLATMPGNLVVAEFPFGDPAWELRSVYYSTVHWKRILNGYSGGFPPGYKGRVARLQLVTRSPDVAWQTLVDAGTTHVVVHERAFRPGEADVVESWLQTHGATAIGHFDGDVLYDLPHAP
jgi:hypothetical protein